jgi:polyketide cyclase/dehydrase/lipid transport protein
MTSGRVLLVLALLSCGAITVQAASPPQLTIVVDSTGLAEVRAVLTLPASPVVVRSVLTDYPHWPALFPAGLRVIAIQQEERGVRTELYLRSHFLIGELHLVTLTRERAPGVLETSLIDGDFRQYRRIWVLVSGEHADETHAELEMEVQPKMWIPDWLFTMALQRELSEHFEKLSAEVKSR